MGPTGPTRMMCTYTFLFIFELVFDVSLSAQSVSKRKSCKRVFAGKSLFSYYK